MFKIIIDSLKAIIEHDKAQARINMLIGKKKKSDYIKLKLPKNYIGIIEVVAMYGINDSVELLKILESNAKK